MIKKLTRYGIPYLFSILLIAAGGLPLACGGDGGTEATDKGVGDECMNEADCDETQNCLDFKGGYCGLEDCVDDDDCPDGSFCVMHDDGINYCFLECTDKSDCNVNRSDANEANCVGSGTVDFVEPGHNDDKVCVPPSA